MECHRLTINLKKKDDIINLRPIGDPHIGNLAWDEKKYLETLDYIAKHDNYITIGMGDYIDNVMAWANGSVDKRWNPETVERNKLTTEEQIQYFVQSWKKVADKSIGLHSGNHEWKTINQQRFIGDFCNPVNKAPVQDPETKSIRYEPVINPKIGRADTLYHQKYLGRVALIGLSFAYQKKEIAHYELLSFHGGYAGSRDGGIINRMEDIESSFEGIDLTLMGHTHSTIIKTSVKIGRDRTTNRPYERKTLIANTGTFLRSFQHGVDSYIESSPRRSKRVGTVTITFDPYNKKLFGHD